MSTSASIRPITTEDLLAMPDDGIDRELIRGELREQEMTRRSRLHAQTEASIVYLLQSWLMSQPEPRGRVLSGEAGCILRRDPDTTVGIDVVFISADLAARESDETTLIDGAPVLAVEILSPSDKQERITEKIDEYLVAGVELVWIVDPHFRTVTVHCSDAKPVLFNSDQRLAADPQLPGFQVAVQDIFQ